MWLAAVASFLLSQTEPSQSFALAGGVEVLAETLPSAGAPRHPDGFLTLAPLLAAEVSERFVIEVGAPVRFRVVDSASFERGAGFSGFIRREDFDESSDWGQLLRYVRVGQEGEPVSLVAGAMRVMTLGRGQLLRRYDNRLNPDYHPSGAALEMLVGPLRLEALTSDVFSSRIVAVAAGLDLGRAFDGAAGSHDRFHLGASFARDGGLSRIPTPSVSLVSVDLDAGLYRSTRFQWFALASVASRVAPWGSLAPAGGFAAQSTWGALSAGAKAELRHNPTGFRHAMFGAHYELSRYASVGQSGPGIVDERTRPTNGLAGEISVSRNLTTLTAAVEHLFRGRTDVDVSWVHAFSDMRGVWTLRAGAVGLGVLPRYELSTELRARLSPSLYTLGWAGLLYFPQADSTLAKGVCGGLGLGADFEI